nr:MAG: hypothetical protein DIU59_15555 [Pseudomonadota bacterium]
MADDEGRMAEPADQDETQAPQGDIDWKAMARKWERRAKETENRLREAEERGEATLKQLREQLEAAQKRAGEAEGKLLRMEVAAAKGLTPAQARRLQGATREELEADADELLETFGVKRDQGQAEEKAEEGEPVGSLFGRPRERLTSGAAPDSEPEPDSKELADEVLRRTRGQ